MCCIDDYFISDYILLFIQDYYNKGNIPIILIIPIIIPILILYLLKYLHKQRKLFATSGVTISASIEVYQLV